MNRRFLALLAAMHCLAAVDPVAQPQNLTTQEDQPLLITLVGAGEDLTYVISRLPGLGTIYQTPDGTHRGIAITTSATEVTDPGHRLIYLPPPDIGGQNLGDFQFLVRQGGKDSAPATVTINVEPVNDPPIADHRLPDFFLPKGQSWTWQVPIDTFHDVEDGLVSYSATQDTGAALPVWLTFDAASRTFNSQSGPPDSDLMVIGITVKGTDKGGASTGTSFQILCGLAQILNQPAGLSGHGSVVAMADGLLAVSAPAARTVVIYRLHTGAWTEEARLQPQDGQASEWFGTSLMVVQGGIAVGDPGFKLDTGRVSLFYYSQQDWAEADPLVLSDGQPGDRFGRAMTQVQDQILIGAPGRQNGLVVVFGLEDAGFVEGQRLTSGWTGFGTVLAAAGNRLLVGDPDYSDQSGCLAVWSRQTGSDPWLEGAVIPGTNPGDRWGAALAIRGNEGLVSSPGAAGVGGILGLDLQDLEVLQANPASRILAVLSLGNLPLGSLFGWSIALTGNLLVVGAPGADGGAGQAYAFAVAETSLGEQWSFFGPLVPSADRLAGGILGQSVAQSGLWWATGGSVAGQVRLANLPFVNQAPRWLGTEPPTPVVHEDGFLVLTLLSEDPDLDDSVTFALVSEPTGASLYQENGTLLRIGDQLITSKLQFRPWPDANGRRSFSLRLVDNHGASIQVAVQVEVTPQPDPPRLVQSLPDRVARKGSPASFPLPAGTFSEVDGQAMTYALVGEVPAGVTCDSAGALTVDATVESGMYELRLQATDPDGSITGEFQFLVVSDIQVTQMAGSGTGTAVAIGQDWLAIGTPGAESVTVASLTDTMSSQTVVLPDSRSGDAFGSSVAWFGPDLIVGAPGRHGGTVYRFSHTIAGEWQIEDWFTVEAGNRIGAVLAADGQWVLVGATGAAFAWSPATGDRYPLDAPPELDPDAQFGGSLDLADGVAVVGAPGQKNRTGAVWCYRYKDPEGWSLDHRVELPLAGAGDQVGSAVAVGNGQLLVGAPGVAAEAGAVYSCLLDQSSERWVYAATLPAVGLHPQDRFGRTLSWRGHVALVGVPGASQVRMLRYRPGDDRWQEAGRYEPPANEDHAELGQAVTQRAGLALMGGQAGAAWLLDLKYLNHSPQISETFTYILKEGDQQVISLPVSDGDLDRLRWQVESLGSLGSGPVLYHDAGCTKPLATFPALITDPQGRFWCKPGEDDFGPQYAIITVRVDDGWDSRQTTVTVHVVGQNDGPAITAPSTLSMVEDHDLPVSISLSDVDASDLPLSLTLQVDAGTLSLPAVAQQGPWEGMTKLSLTASVAELNAALGSLIFRCPVPPPSNQAVLSCTVNDLGNTGEGGAKEAKALMAIGITPVNDPPQARRQFYTLVGVELHDWLQPTDEEGDAITSSSVTAETGGHCTLQADGRFTFLPTLTAPGQAGFDLVLADAHGAQSTQTIIVTVLSNGMDRPQIIGDPPLVVRSGQTWQWTLRVEGSTSPDLIINLIDPPQGLGLGDSPDPLHRTLGRDRTCTLVWPKPEPPIGVTHCTFQVILFDPQSLKGDLRQVVLRTQVEAPAAAQ